MSVQVHFFVGFFVHVSFFVCSEFQPLIKYIICKYFFYSIGCLFILIVSCDAVLNFDVVQFMFLCLLIMLLVLHPRGNGQIHSHEVFSPMLSSKSFVILCLTFKSYIHF